MKFKSTPLLLDSQSANVRGSYLRAYHQSIGMESDSDSAEFQLYIQYSDELTEEPDRIPVLQYRLEYNPAIDQNLQDILTSGSPIIE